MIQKTFDEMLEMLGEGLGGRHDSGETLACLANDCEAEHLAKAAKEDWGQQLGKAKPKVTFCEEN